MPSSTGFWTTDCSAGLHWTVVLFQYLGFKGAFGFLLQCTNRCHFCSKSMTESVQMRTFSGTVSQKYWIRGCFFPPIKIKLLQLSYCIHAIELQQLNISCYLNYNLQKNSHLESMLNSRLTGQPFCQATSIAHS